MKKWLIFLISLFNILIGINSVSAKTETATYKFTSDKNAIINTYNMTNEEIKNYTSTYKVASDSITNRIADNFIKLREYYENNYKSKYDYYIIINYLNYSGGYFQLFAFNEDSINQKLGNMINSSSYYKILAVNFFNLSANKFESVYLDNNNKFKTSSSTYNTYVYSGGDTNSFNINYQSTYYETNYNMDISLSSTGHNSIVYDSFTYDSKIYYPNDFLFNTMTSNELNRLKDTKPKLTYKTGFTSSEAYSVLGKVSVDYSLVDNVDIYKNNWQQVKLQFGANDFKKGNIPVFSHFKLYGRYNSSDTWKSADDYIDKGYIDIQIVDTTYDYSEGMLADASITLQVNYNFTDENEGNIEELLYHYYKLEFYLDNTQNGFIYCYDNLNNSKWEDTAKFLEDYIYYYFPTNYKYAFITSEKNQNDGKIYFPTNSVNNDLIKLQGQYYNLSNKTFSRSIPNFIYDQDDYYSYFDFSFNDSQNILVMNRILGSVTYENWYNSAFLEGWNFLTGPLYWGTLTSVSENSYFYAPIGYNVYFTNDTNIKVITSQGEITVDIENSKNDYESKVDNNNTNNIFNIFSNESNLVAQVFKPFLEIWNASKTYVGIFNYILIVIIGSIIILLLKSKNK